MEWLNLHVTVLDSPDVLRCDPTQRATWLFLLRYCIGQENGGIIRECFSWGDTTWQQIVRVKLREVKRDSPLWYWDGDSLTVKFYPVEKESEVKAKRELARVNGARGGRPKITNVGSSSVSNNEPMLDNSQKAERNRKGIGKEVEGEIQSHDGDTKQKEPIEQDPADVIGPVIKSPPQKVNIQATGKDLLVSLGGMLEWFRSRDGRAEAESDLEAALTITTHQEIETAVRWGFKKLNKKIRTSEVLDAVQGYREHLINERINQPDPVLVRALAEANRMGFDAVAKLLGLECDPALVPEILSENPGTLAEFTRAIA